MAKATITWDGEAAAAENARLKLPELAAQYFARGRELLAGKPAFDALHAFRLETKRFRYTLEMFRPVYGRGLDPYLAELRKVQTALGEINDCVATRAHVERLMPAGSPVRRRVERYLDRRAAGLTAAFLRLWRSEFDAPGRAARWHAYLGRATRPRSRRAPARPS